CRNNVADWNMSWLMPKPRQHLLLQTGTILIHVCLQFQLTHVCICFNADRHQTARCLLQPLPRSMRLLSKHPAWMVRCFLFLCLLFPFLGSFLAHLSSLIRFLLPW